MPTTKVKPLGRTVVKGNQGIKIVRSCTINRPAEELYRYWRQLENLPKFMKHLIAVTQTSPVESHWSARAPGGPPVEWDAIIFNEHENSMIAWRSMEGAEVPNAGSVRFEPAPGGQGTEVTVSLEYSPPFGKLGSLVAKMTGEEPGQQIADDLARFKALMETGEIPSIEGQPRG